MICPVCLTDRNIYLDILAIDTEGYCTTCDNMEEYFKGDYCEDIYLNV